MTASSGADDLVVRRGSLDDVAAAAEVKAVGWATAYDGLVPGDVLARFSSPQRWVPVLLRAASGPGAFFVVADLGGSVIGLAHGLLGESLYLTSLHVLPAHRSHGVGAALMHEVLGLGARSGAPGLELDVVTANGRAIAFYQGLGADVVGEHAAAWSDAVIETRLRVPLA